MAFGIDDAAIATVLAGLVSTAGALYANRKNIDAQKEANSINWEIARQNNATQIEMANTAHQREVRDLRRAGLNPILSAGGNGSSTPSLSSASISPTHTDNAFEGLANSAKGVGRYFSQEYKQQLAGMGLANEQADLANRQASVDLGVSKLEAKAAKVEARNQLDQAELKRDALTELLGTTSVNTPHGVRVDFSPKQYDKMKDLQKEAITSDIKLQANSNWRANLSSFTPFVSPAAINSAGAAAQRLRYLWRTR